jgi:hypothetical protein
MGKGGSMRRKACVICLAAALLLIPALVSQAGAALMSYHVAFSANSFESALGATPPVDPVEGSFDITFDPSLIYPEAGTTTGITLNTLNIALDSALSFTYNDPSYPPDLLGVGGISQGPGAVLYVPATNDFALVIDNFSTGNPTFLRFAYSQTAVNNDYFSTETGSVTFTPIPLPATLPLVFSGLGALVAWRRSSA